MFSSLLQLDNQNLPDQMATEVTVTNPPRGKNQALNGDYVGAKYDRGHLAPVAHQNTQACVDATFTLTNAAPQNPSFNRGQWRVTEKKVADNLKKNCIAKRYTAFIVTGVVPGNVPIGKGVNIPSYFWSAYCCIDNNNINKLSGGFYGQNINQPVTSVTVQALETFLSQQYNTGFQVFPGIC